MTSVNSLSLNKSHNILLSKCSVVFMYFTQCIVIGVVVIPRWGEEEYWRRLEEEERMWDEHESHRHGMDWGHRMGPPRPDFSDMVRSTLLSRQKTIPRMILLKLLKVRSFLAKCCENAENVATQIHKCCILLQTLQCCILRILY